MYPDCLAHVRSERHVLVSALTDANPTWVREVGAYSFVACFGRLTIDHASLSRRSTVPTPNRHLQQSGANYVLSIHYIGTFHLSYALPVSPSVATIYLLG